MASAAAAPVRRIVITGGPCSGKTSVLPVLDKALRSKGWEVYLVPEIPTILQSGGAKYPGPDAGERLMQFESALVRMQLAAEDSFAQIARSTGAPSVIIHDRALLDISAYLPADLWSALLEREGLTGKGVLARYDGVVHMVTAADGAEEFYTLSTNTARTETAEQARALDKAVLDAWGSHPVHCKAENPAEGGFDAKAATVVAAVLDQVGNAR